MTADAVAGGGQAVITNNPIPSMYTAMTWTDPRTGADWHIHDNTATTITFFRPGPGEITLSIDLFIGQLVWA